MADPFGDSFGGILGLGICGANGGGGAGGRRALLPLRLGAWAVLLLS